MSIRKWKPVRLEGGFLNENLSDLIGIEELTDYNLEQFTPEETPDNFQLEKKLKKRKASELDFIEVDFENDVKKSKKAKKSKKIDTITNVTTSNKPKKTKKFNENDNINVSTPGKFVLLPKKIKTKKQKPVKRKTEVGSKLTKFEKCPINEMQAWLNYGLPDELIQALADLGFRTPTQIQDLTLKPAILGRRDILGAAETGSGKTLAFGLPIITRILELKNQNLNSDTDSGFDKDFDDEENNFNDKISNIGTESQIFYEDDSDELTWEDDDENTENPPKNIPAINKSLTPLYALILTPTRELAIQVKNHLIAITKYTNIRVAAIVGGMAAVKQERVLSKCPEIVVATPGRLWELIQEGNSHLSKVDNIKYFAIDETDRMVERGHFHELHNLLERINANDLGKKTRQNFVFSATLTLVHDLPKHLLTKKKLGKGRNILKLTPGQKIQRLIDMVGMTNPKVVDISRETGTAASLTECRITCPIEDKDYYLYYFLKRHPGRTLVFCNSIGCVKRLTTLFNLLKCEPIPLHASIQQRQRLKNLERFRDNPNGILVATDVAARGLDIPEVQHVIHYQVPRTAENYVHRSGRTARAMSEGIAILIMEPTELRTYIKLCHTLGKTEDLPLFPVEDKMLSAVKQRVNLARDLDKLELQTRRANSETGWLQKAIEEMDIIVDDRDTPGHSYDIETISKQKREAHIKRKQLDSLLSQPVFPKGFSFKYPSLNINQIKDKSDENAITVMKSAMENYARSGKNKLGSLIQKIKKPPKDIKRERKLFKQRKKDAKKKEKKKLQQKKAEEVAKDE